MKKIFDFFPVYFLKHPILRALFLLGCFLFLVSFFLILFKIKTLSLPLILHFDSLSGVDMFGDAFSLWGVWLLGLSFFVLNSFLGEILFFRERALTFAFFSTNLLISVLFLIIISVIITVN